MLVSVHSDELLIVRIPVGEIGKSSLALIQLFFFNDSSSPFFSYTATEEEVSLIVKKSCVDPFLIIPGISISPMTWRALRLCEGEQISGGLIAQLIAILAESSISIFYLSTSCNDHVLVMTSDLDNALACLNRQLSIELDAIEPEVDAFQSSPVEPDWRSHAESELRRGTSPADVEPSPICLSQLAGHFYLVSIAQSDIDQSMRSLIRILFVNPSIHFICLSAVEQDYISLIVNEAMFKHLSGSGLRCQAEWSAFQVLGQWGWSDIGLVDSITAPLHKAGMEPLHLSTYSRDFILVEANKADNARQIFLDMKFALRTE